MSSVYKVFENVAQKYDMMNDAMSLGIHRLWKDTLLLAMHPQPGARLLDVAGGTGTALMLNKYKAHSTIAFLSFPQCYCPIPQVTLPSVSWSTLVPSRSG